MRSYICSVDYLVFQVKGKDICVFLDPIRRTWLWYDCPTMLHRPSEQDLSLWFTVSSGHLAQWWYDIFLDQSTLSQTRICLHLDSILLAKLKYISLQQTRMKFKLVYMRLHGAVIQKILQMPACIVGYTNVLQFSLLVQIFQCTVALPPIFLIDRIWELLFCCPFVFTRKCKLSWSLPPN